MLRRTIGGRLAAGTRAGRAPIARGRRGRRPSAEALENKSLLALIGVFPDFPQINLDSGGRVSYTYDSSSATGTFRLVNSEPISYKDTATSTSVVVGAPRAMQLEFRTDGAGSLIGGVAGDDLTLTGVIDLNGDTVPEFSGVLLTGEIERFGFLENPAADPDTDTFDFLLTPTGGALLSRYGGRKIGIRLAAEPAVPNFNGSFTTDFMTVAKGTVGPFAFGALGDRVFHDQNLDGLQTTGELGVAGVTVELLNNLGTVVETQQTDAMGNYLFTDLPNGVYQVRFTRPAGSAFTAANVGADDTIDSDAVASLVDQTGTSPAVFVVSNTVNRTVDAGLILPGRLSGSVYIDRDDDGVFDAGEVPLGGVGLELTGTDYLGNPVVRTTVTDGTGFYEFTGLAPSGPMGYTVRQVTQPAGYADGAETTDNVTALPGTRGGPDVITGLVVGSGGSNPDNNFGELAARLGDYAFRDLDADGVQDAGEPALAGVKVELIGPGDMVLATAVTDANGLYLFDDLAAGTYTVRFMAPVGSGLVFTRADATGPGATDANDSDADPTTGRTAPVVLGAGADNRTVDVGFVALSSLAGFVYLDADRDGMKDPGESGIGGVTITLQGTDIYGRPVLSTVQTAPDGSYKFDGLVPGTYSLDEDQPAFDDGLETIGSAGGVLVDNDLIGQIALGQGVAGVNYNFGEVTSVGIGQAQTATIGYWRNKNGQALICGFGRTDDNKTLGQWMAASFPRLFGSQSQYNLTNLSNAQIAALYKDTIFRLGAPKAEAQVWATVFNVFASTRSLGGPEGTNFGFSSTVGGLGSATINVGSRGAALGLPNHTNQTILTLIQRANAVAVNGRFLANRGDIADLFSTINEAGHV